MRIHYNRYISCSAFVCTATTLNLVSLSSNKKPQYADHHSLCPYKECRELQPGTQCVRNGHISIAQHVALFVDRVSQAILICISSPGYHLAECCCVLQVQVPFRKNCQMREPLSQVTMCHLYKCQLPLGQVHT